MSSTIPFHPIILFDGVCNLCDASVQFIIRHDEKKQFRFATLQSDFAKKIKERFNLLPQEYSSFLLFDGSHLYSHSEGALKVLSQLNGWKWTKIFFIVPKFIRDAVYNLIAKYRYKWFGKKDHCMMPSPELAERFLS